MEEMEFTKKARVVADTMVVTIPRENVEAMKIKQNDLLQVKIKKVRSD